MTPSSFPPTTEPHHPDRRDSPRVVNIRPCEYELAHVAGHETIEFTGGQALSLNASRGGLLLLMPQSPEGRQIFEVHTAVQTENERAVKVVEACWMQELTFGSSGRVYLVGVRTLFEPGPSASVS